MDFHDYGMRDHSLMSRCFVSYLRTTASYLLVIDWAAVCDQCAQIHKQLLLVLSIIKSGLHAEIKRFLTIANL